MLVFATLLLRQRFLAFVNHLIDLYPLAEVFRADKECFILYLLCQISFCLRNRYRLRPILPNNRSLFLLLVFARASTLVALRRLGRLSRGIT